MKHFHIICSPHIYYSARCQNLIHESTQKTCNSWIYHVVQNTNEAILYDNVNFTICKNITKKEDDAFKYLIIFKDLSLKTIRDLSQANIPMLLQAYNQALKLISAQKCKSWCVYFNYFPSNYQLHAHVSPSVYNIHLRSHKLLRVVKNLWRDNYYYKKALIFTRISKNNAVFQAYEEHFKNGSYAVNRSQQKIMDNKASDSDNRELNSDET